MGFWLLVFFTTPIVEMYLLIGVGGYIGTWPTVALVMLTAVVGVALLRRQGLATLTRIKGRLESGQLPAEEVTEGILLAVAGALLLTPGFVTDAVGFLLLFPPIRRGVARRMLARLWAAAAGADAFGRDAGDLSRAGGPTIIEGEFESRSDPRRGPADEDRPSRGPR